MCDYLYQSEFEKLKIKAAFFGVNLDDKKEIKHKEKDSFLFKDPSDYDGMTVDERKELTNKMVGQHQKWAMGGKLKGKQ